jgi:energy-coupling factor transporter ATP-binding protein EcfA2
MKLKTARIQNYRCIDDSEPFEVEEVTALVGKNEAGKTAVLKALHKLNPERTDEGNFSALEDYPRSRYSEYSERLRSDPRPDSVLTTVWELEGEDRTALDSALGKGVVSGSEVTISKGYDNKLKVGLEVDEAALVGHLVSGAGLPPEHHEAVSSKKTIRDLLDAAKAIQPAQPQVTALIQRIEGGQLHEDPPRVATDTVVKLLPKFLYFADYEKMIGQVAMDPFLRKTPDQRTFPERIFQALLDLANVSAKEIQESPKFEELAAKLESVSNRISREIFAYWSQNKNLQVVCTFDHARPQDPPPFNQGFVFRARVKNLRHGSTVGFDDRSTGFVWFFSFLVWFSQISKTYGNRLVILLDEPGLSLHAKAQADLLRYINEKLRPRHQVLYTTHSPFMVDTDNFLGVRTVEDVETKAGEVFGTKVGDKSLSADPDTVFPLYAAMGVDVTQSLFVGKHTLLVEGPSDLLYLQWASNELRLAGRTGLDPRWTICPSGGLDKVWSFLTLFGGSRLHAAVLSDFSDGIKKKVRDLRERGSLPSDHVLSADSYVGKNEADVEDLVGRPLYSAVVNARYGLKGAEMFSSDGHVSSGPRAVKEAEAHFERLKQTMKDPPLLDHYSPAAYLAEHAAEYRKSSGYNEALDRFERLFRDLNALLPKAGH